MSVRLMMVSASSIYIVYRMNNVTFMVIFSICIIHIYFPLVLKHQWQEKDVMLFFSG